MSKLCLHSIMGCACCRYSSSESSLLSNSLKTGLEKHPTDHVVSTIRRYAPDIHSVVNPDQLLLIESALGLNKVSEALEPFYASVTETTKLIAAAVFLSKGTAEVKAAALLGLLQRTMPDKLTFTEASVLTTLMFTVVVDSLPLLVLSPTAKQTAYLEKCRTHKDNAAYLLRLILKGEEEYPVSEAAFTKKWVTLYGGRLLEPAGLRDYITLTRQSSLD